MFSATMFNAAADAREESRVCDRARDERRERDERDCI